MAGVETAGLVLATFPLIISYLEHYRKGCKTIKLWWKYRPAYIEFSHTIGIQNVLYRENLEELLSPIVPGNELESLLADPRGEAWHQDDLEDALRARLPKSYDYYCEIIGRVHTVMRRLGEKLGIDEMQPGVSVNASLNGSKSKLDREKLRFKFAFQKGEWDELAKALKTHIEELQALLGSSNRLAIYRRRRKTHFISTFQRIRDRAYHLHSALAQSWNCDCQSSHSARLLLDSAPPEVEECSEKPQKPPFHFEVLFIFPEHAIHTSPPWMSHEAKVLVLDNGGNKVVAAGLKKIRFAPDPLQSDLSPETDNLIEIIDLCRAIKDAQRTPPLRGFLRGGENQRLVFFPVESRLKRGASESHEFVSLETLLRHPAEEGILVLTRQERYKIAVTLASSFLQLHTTPWLEDKWSKKDILFARDGVGARPLIDRPYVARDYSPATAPAPLTPATMSPHVLSPDTSREGLFRLGVVLLELCFGQAMEDQQIRQQCLGPNGECHEFTDRMTAFLWRRGVLGESGPEFDNAIRRCLDCAFGPKSTNLADDDFKEAVYNEVVEPLMKITKCWDDYTQGKS
ncbi:MAG: hypothetical protein M1823_000216 [Watsoniomyces obsoletus]|nr:MAG: hypothetical protein M1823_000216 [Watsoniomyces obsoletus]